MEFTSYLWNLYRNSSEGRAAIDSDVSCLTVTEIRGESIFTHQLGYCEISDSEFIGQTKKINLREIIKEYAKKFIITNINEAERLFVEIVDEGLSWIFEDEGKNFESFYGGGKLDTVSYSEIFTSIAGLSTGLHDAHSEYFIPYLLSRRFDELEKICHSLNIALPEVPGKLEKRDRALYYLAINRAFYNFRKGHGLSPQEFNALLYDFAPKNHPFLPSNEMPAPSRVWFVIGGVGKNGDFEYLDDTDVDSVSYWQGNLETRRGDIILMWCASPRSYLHSIWRALDEGFVDPYFYYYTMIRVGFPIRITPVPFSEFSKHPLLGKMPAVRARFQGASGKAFRVEEYAAICDLLHKQGFDLSKLPLPPTVKEFFVEGLNNERDVELKLLEPLLRRLRFSEKDWLRQLSVRMGRGERNYPDYVLGGDPRPGEECAIAVIECKFEINTQKDVRETFIQAKSYALRLQAKVVALADRRGLWIFQLRNDGFSIDLPKFKTWKELSHPDCLHEISLIFGKRVIDDFISERKQIGINRHP